MARHHYRGTKIALWLDLIPKLQHGDDLDPRYHLLDNYNNQSTFEDFGTRELNMDEVNPPSTTSEYDLTTVITTPTTMPTTPTTTTTTTRRPWRATRKARPRITSTTTPVFPSTHFMSSNADASIDDMDTTLSLSLTVVVGCSLLILNIVIFAGVYYQKDRIRKERKARQQEMMEHKALRRGEDSYGGCGGPDGDCLENHHQRMSSGPDTDTNSSSMATPPVPPACITRHQVSPQTTILPKQSIPVLPPQAPFARTLSRDSNYSTYSTSYHDSPHQRSPRVIRTLERGADGHIRAYDRDCKIRNSTSADSGTEINCVNPITTV